MTRWQPARWRDARQLIATEPPAVAVLDLGLPDGDGLALLTELRRPGSELDPELPVLILSGRASELDRVRGLERGADDYLVKAVQLPGASAAAGRAAAAQRGPDRDRAGPGAGARARSAQP